VSAYDNIVDHAEICFISTYPARVVSNSFLADAALPCLVPSGRNAVHVVRLLRVRAMHTHSKRAPPRMLL